MSLHSSLTYSLVQLEGLTTNQDESVMVPFPKDVLSGLEKVIVSHRDIISIIYHPSFIAPGANSDDLYFMSRRLHFFQ